jgi:hypothetical protein
MVVVLVFFLFVMLAGFLLELQKLTGPGIDFSRYRDAISVVESRMSFGRGESNLPTVNVVLVITNQSDFAWRLLEFDTRFFNKAGTMIDARPYHDGSTVLPHDDLALRIVTTPLNQLAEYDNCKVYVRAARDARSRFY